MRKLMTYAWPGNVRELSNVIERATVISSGPLIGVTELPPEVAGSNSVEESSYHEAMADFERALVRSTLERVNGDRREAARILGLSLATLYRRIEKLGLKDKGSEPAVEELR
jgi:DNA-binding NtrC family response regulator